MLEEFHADNNGAKQLYGWGTINANIWLPSLSELVGIDTNNYHEPHGIYFSAMQGLNLSEKTWTDAQGSAQFTCFEQFNTSGGGQKLWDACNREITWLRSPRYFDAVIAWVVDSDNSLNAYYSLTSLPYAVHPAVLLEQVPYLVDASFISLGLVFISIDYNIIKEIENRK